MSINAKIKPTKSKVEGRPPSYQFAVVRNARKSGTRMPTPETVSYIGTLPPTEYTDPKRCAAFLELCQQTIYKLIWDEVITVPDGKKVMDRFRNAEINGIKMVCRSKAKGSIE